MNKIIKCCPRCGYKTDNERDNFCPVCVDQDESVRLIEKVDIKKQISSSQKAAATTVNEGVAAAISGVKESAGTPDISFGRGNAISGDINVDNHSTIGNVTVVNEKPTQAQELADKKRAFRSECKKYCIDGFISDSDLTKLDDLRTELDLDKDIATDILDEVKNLSKKNRTELPPAGRIKLEYAVNAVERNDDRAISSAIVDLEGWMGRVQSDELNQMYYQLYAIIRPGKYSDLLKSNTKEDYWKTFWSYIAYGVQGLQGDAESSLAELTAWDSFYPAQNQSLLSVIGYLMRNEEAASRSAFARLGLGYSKELQPIYNTLQELLEKDWSNASSALSSRSKFYVKTLFGEFYKGLEQKQKEAERIKSTNEAKRLEEEARAREENERLQHQKESFILAYTESDGEVDLACQKVGITNAVFNAWLTQDRAFKDSFNDAQERIAQKREEQKQQDAENNRLKKEFIQLYKSNDCDLLKTCAESGIALATFRDWNNSDQVFADKVRYVQKIQKGIARRKRAKKALPIILIALLVGLIAVGINSLRQKVALEQERQEQIEQERLLSERYEAKIEDFNRALANANNSNVESLGIAGRLLVEIREMEDNANLKVEKKSAQLRNSFDNKADAIMRELSIILQAADATKASDPEGSSILSQKSDDYKKVEKYKNMVAQ